MTRDDIIKLAREAGVRVARMLYAMENNEAALTETEARDIAAIERFAALIAAAEREACAKVCEEHWRFNAPASECADAIRARGQHG